MYRRPPPGLQCHLLPTPQHTGKRANEAQDASRKSVVASNRCSFLSQTRDEGARDNLPLQAERR